MEPTPGGGRGVELGDMNDQSQWPPAPDAEAAGQQAWPPPAPEASQQNWGADAPTTAWSSQQGWPPAATNDTPPAQPQYTTPQTGYVPQTGYAPQGGNTPQTGYAPAAGNTPPQPGYAPQAAYAPQAGYATQPNNYPAQPGYPAQPNYPAQPGYQQPSAYTPSQYTPGQFGAGGQVPGRSNRRLPLLIGLIAFGVVVLAASIILIAEGWGALVLITLLVYAGSAIMIVPRLLRGRTSGFAMISIIYRGVVAAIWTGILIIAAIASLFVH